MSTYDWERSATCASADPEAWFPGPGESSEPAIAICWDICPVRRECLEAAMAEEHPDNPARHLRHGVRGGHTPQERAHLQRRRDRLTLAETALTTLHP